MNSRTFFGLIATGLAICGAFALGGVADAEDRSNDSLFEAWRTTQEGIVLQCGVYKQYVDCNWERYNKEVDLMNNGQVVPLAPKKASR